MNDDAHARFATAAQPVVATTVITTPADGLTSGEVAIPLRDGAGRGTLPASPLPAYRSAPAGPGPHPVVLVVQEIFGVHEHIRDLTRRLAHRGYLAIAPELYFRLGDPGRAASIDALREGFVHPTPDLQVMRDLDATLQWAASHGGDPARVAVTGFCWGGRIVWLYSAHQPLVKAGVAWYGRLAGPATPGQPSHPLDIAGELKGPVLGLYGGQDTGIPLGDVEAVNHRLAALGAPSRIHVYPQAPHAFLADYRTSYRKDAAEDGWGRMLDWFAAHGVA